MDLTRFLEDFEGLPPEDQLEFMASVAPAFCRRVRGDPAHRRAVMARCLGQGLCPLRRLANFLAAGGITAMACVAGLRAGVARLARGAPCQLEG